MTLQNVTERFKALSGLSSESVGQWSGVIEDAFEDIKRRVRSDCDTQENCRSLEAAAGALAFYNHRAILSAREDTASFKAGDVTVERGGGVNEAYALFLRALEPCAELFKDDEFLFGRMENVCTET